MQEAVVISTIFRIKINWELKLKRVIPRSQYSDIRRKNGANISENLEKV